MRRLGGFRYAEKGNTMSRQWEMWEGVAIGGPRSGAKLSASPTWNGIVLNPQKQPYQGRYKYDLATGTWMWHEK